MYLANLQLLQFKNFDDASFDFSDKINCFLGMNGEGKTNLLDAIFYLAFCKSFFNPIDAQIIKNDASFMVIQGDFKKGKNNDESEQIYCGLKKGQKKQFKRNKKQYERLADHIGLIPLVMISPSDIQLVMEGSESRRRFVDLIISQFDHQYLNHLIQYNKALSQRNRLLKKFMESRHFDPQSLEIWDEQLNRYGTPIFQARKDFLSGFLPLFQKHYDFISNKKEQVALKYISDLDQANLDQLLLQKRDKDRRLTYTSVGVHRDDLAFSIEGRPLKKFGSQGQQKTFLLALKLAQAEFLKNKKKLAPILLLDDIYDKLDEKRVAKLMEIIKEDWFGQVFITDTHPERLPQIFDQLKSNYKTFYIQNGGLKNE